MKCSLIITVTLSMTLTLTAQTFVDVATALGWPSANDSTRGLGWADYDGDGDFDVYLQNQGTTSRLLRNDGTTFTNVTSSMVVGHASSGWSCAWGDFDNDGRPDLYLGNFQGNNCFRNVYPGAFVDMALVNGTTDNTFAQSVIWCDHDRDGDLDLYLTKELNPHRFFENQGNGLFFDITAQVGLADPQSHSYGVTFGDFDGDGDPDAFVSTCGTNTVNRLFRNNQAGGGGLLYSEIAAIAGVNYTPNTYATDWVDFDDDGDLDLWVTGNAGEPNHLYRNDGVFPMVDIAVASGVAGPPLLGRGADFGDYDNDGRIDIYVHDASGPSRLYRNLGSLNFAEVPNAAGASNVGGTGYDCAMVDFDNDGDLDIHVATSARDRLYQNSGNANRWLQVFLRGTRDNRSAIGAKIEITAGGQIQHRTYNNGAGAFSQNLLPSHFGTGAELVVSQVLVKWIDGTTDTLTNVPTNQRITITQSSGQAIALAVGAGCANSANQIPVLSTIGQPILGNGTFGLLVGVAPAAVPVSLFLTPTVATTPLPVGNGCFLHLDLAAFLALLQTNQNPVVSGVTGSFGTVAFSFPLPNIHPLAGFDVAFQAALFDSTALPLPGGGIPLTTTNALSLRLGY